MPTYDYVCDACQFEQEVFQTFKEDPLTECPKCHAASFRRKLGAGAALIFKGSGFYTTDYRSEGYKKAAAADQPSSAPAAGATEASKPADATAPAAPNATTSSAANASGSSSGNASSGGSSSSGSSSGGGTPPPASGPNK